MPSKHRHTHFTHWSTDSQASLCAAKEDHVAGSLEHRSY